LEQGKLDQKHKSIAHIQNDCTNLKGKTLGRKPWVGALKGLLTADPRLFNKMTISESV